MDLRKWGTDRRERLRARRLHSPDWLGRCAEPIAFAALAVAATELAVVAAVAALYGVCNGVLTIVRGLAAPGMITTHRYGAIKGAMNAPATIAKALAPLAAAALWSISQSYAPVLIAIMAGSLILAFGFWAAAWASTRRQGGSLHAEL